MWTKDPVWMCRRRSVASVAPAERFRSGTSGPWGVVEATGSGCVSTDGRSPTPAMLKPSASSSSGPPNMPARREEEECLRKKRV
eukprot:scaffold12477_cov119-Isochrysis_galbana.AAC.3